MIAPSFNMETQDKTKLQETITKIDVEDTQVHSK